jgi:hypothetical protein
VGVGGGDHVVLVLMSRGVGWRCIRRE